MAGTVTTTEKANNSARKLTFAWTSDASGDADGTSTNYFDGDILGLTTIPDGAAVPATNYDVAINDEDGHDVLLGQGANRSPTATEHVVGTSLAVVSQSKLTLDVTNGGNAKQGTVIVYIR